MYLLLCETQRKNTPDKPPVVQSNLQPSTLNTKCLLGSPVFIIKEITFREVLYIMAVIGGPSERKMISTLSPMDQLTFLNCLLSILF